MITQQTLDSWAAKDAEELRAFNERAEACEGKARTTVKLPDGFNGSTMLFNVTPVEVDGHLVKLSCAEEGKGYLIRWIGRSELQNHINAQDIEEKGLCK